MKLKNLSAIAVLILMIGACILNLSSCDTKNKDVEIKCLKHKEASKFSSTDSRAFKVIEEICVRSDPDVIVAPYLVMGGTDACFYEPVCENIYRFAPFHVSTKLLLCTHATNERCPVAVLDEGVSFFKRYIRMLTKD